MDSNAYMIRIRNLREDFDYTQEAVAQYLGTSQTMYARYERGANEIPVRHIIKLCRLYSVSSDYLLGLTDVLPEATMNAIKNHVRPCCKKIIK